jgi:hypothetical protein
MNADRLLLPLTPFGYKHPLLVSRVRIAVGVWLLILTAIVYADGPGGGWGALLVPAAALNFYLAYRMPRALRASASSRDAK